MGCCTRGADYYSFGRAVSNIYFDKALLVNFISNLRKYFFFADSLLMEDFEQFALQKELIIAPFVERFPKNYPEKHYKASRAMRFRTVFF